MTSGELEGESRPNRISPDFKAIDGSTLARASAARTRSRTETGLG